MMWDAETGKQKKRFSGHSSSIYSLLVLGEDGKRFLSGSSDWTIKMWSVESGECLRTMEGHSGCVCSLISIGDGLVMSGSYDREIREWNLNTGECVRTLTGHTDWINCLCKLSTADNDNQTEWILSGSGDMTVRMWNVKTGECLVFNMKAAVRCICQLDDGRIVVGLLGEALQIFRLSSVE